MIGFHSLVTMVLESVDRLSDEEPPNTDAANAGGAAAAKPPPAKKGKGKSKNEKPKEKKVPANESQPSGVSKPAASVKAPDTSLKRPATCQGGPKPKVAKAKAMKKPAAHGTADLKVTKTYVKRDGKYSFKINGSQKLLVH